MAVKQILTEPNEILRQISKPVESVSKEDQVLMDDMLETMYAANGIGLAAIQIGIAKRIIVMDLSRDNEKKEPRYFVNPVIQNKDSEKSTYEEGCLSVPNQFAEIDRPSSCVVEYLDYDGKKQILKQFKGQTIKISLKAKTCVKVSRWNDFTRNLMFLTDTSQ